LSDEMEASLRRIAVDISEININVKDNHLYRDNYSAELKSISEDIKSISKDVEAIGRTLEGMSMSGYSDELKEVMVYLSDIRGYQEVTLQNKSYVEEPFQIVVLSEQREGRRVQVIQLVVQVLVLVALAVLILRL
jgi:hypothetical protein